MLCQTGIDFYNTVIGGLSGEAGTKKLRGINELSNLYRQQHKDDAKHPGKMISLYKQILSDRATVSFIPAALADDDEAVKVINELDDSLAVNKVFEAVSELFSAKMPGAYDFDKIWIAHDGLINVSMALFGKWDVLILALTAYAENTINNKNKIAKYLKSRAFSLSEIDKALDSYKDSLPQERQELRTVDYMKQYSALLLTVKETRKRFTELTKDALLKIAGNPVQAQVIKEYLDALMNLFHYLKPFINDEETNIDTDFYSALSPLYEQMRAIMKVYNAVRNFVTKKPYSTKKFKLNFKNPTLADGWDRNKERDNTAIILIKDDKFYLGVLNAADKLTRKELDGSKGTGGYRKMNYKLLPGPNKMLPKVFFSDKNKDTFRPPERILNGYAAHKHTKGDTFDLRFCHSLIDYFKNAIEEHPDWSQFGFKFSDTSTYNDMSDFYKEVADQGYKLTFTNIDASLVEKWIDQGRLYLFQIWNKDFAAGATGTPNLHTLYWKALFDPENLKDVVLKLNGEAELFYRRKSIETPSVHKAGTKKVNRRDIDGNPIPNEIYNEIYLYANGRNKIEQLSTEARALIDSGRVRISDVTHDIIKDKRFTQDKFAFHVPLTINFKAGGRVRINSKVNLFLKDNKDVNIIGIDRGERNLVYVSLIDRNGAILEQKNFNVVDKMDYHEKLDQMEKERDKARRSWQTIGNIKEMKEGYLSQVVHEITSMMVHRNAVVVMEDLNFGFKRGRFKVEKQVYQKFEKMLIDKLNYLVFKNTPQGEPGGVLHGLQLTEQFTSFEKLGKQSGFLFYVPASYTSKIDPTTGFANLFNMSEITTQEKQMDFIGRFKSIRYEKACDMFIFNFDYDDFRTYQTSHIKKWSVYTNGKRIINIKNQKGKWEAKYVSPTEEIKQALNKAGINFINGGDILSALKTADKKCSAAVFYAFKCALQMRNSNAGTDEDYIISPVRNASGEFFDSRSSDGTTPKDADANGAYHIALKGLCVLDAIDKNLAEDGTISYKDMTVSSQSWFEFTQTRKTR